MVISIHIPKCAGTSFHLALRAVYGDRLQLNYGGAFHRGQAEAWAVPANVECIHGHFLADTFVGRFPSARLVTWVRDPIERVVSNYHHCLRAPDLRDDCCRRLHEERLTLVEFAELDWMRNTMARYLAGRAVTDFAGVGIAECFDESLAMFRRELGWNQPIPAVPPANTNPGRLTPVYDLDAATRRRLTDLNAADLVLYQEALLALGRPPARFVAAA
jgi:hypothetical protein